MEVVENELLAEGAQAVGKDRLPRWFIDAWLPVDGRVFISRRESRDDIWADADDGEDDDRQGWPGLALMLRAPDFEPEYVERGLAFGAVQRGGQEGFSLDGEAEFGFESVEQVRAFVRRIYSGSGPGTTGGAPPPAPPDRDGGGPREPSPRIAFSDERWAADPAWRLPLYESVEPAAVLAKLVKTDARVAANLLLGSVDVACEQWGDTAAFERMMPQLQAAFLLAGNEQRFWDEEYLPAIRAALESATEPALRRNLETVIFMTEGRYWRWPVFWPASIADLSKWCLPRRQEFPLGLPAHVENWLDAIAYLNADRSYFSEQPAAVWGPLLLALAATLLVGTTAGLNWPRGFPLLPSSVLVDRCMRMAADWVPCAALPKELEDNVAQWSRRAAPDSSAQPPTPPPTQPPPAQPIPPRTLSAG